MRNLFMYNLVVVCLIPLNAFAQCMSGNCVNGRGSFVFPDDEWRAEIKQLISVIRKGG